MAAIIHELRGEPLTLLSEKAIIWKSRSILLVADLHLGKVTHFRKAGIGIPQLAETDTLERLAQLLLDYPVKEVWILGDLFHSSYNRAWDKFKTFVGQLKDIKFVLVKGNHDILNEKEYAELKLIVYDSITKGPFLFTHIPIEDPQTKYNISGHIHPGVYLRGKGLQSLTLPCFHISENNLVLPAFGAFTGLAKISPLKHDIVYAIMESGVVKVQ